jgi:hypothetical protein
MLTYAGLSSNLPHRSNLYPHAAKDFFLRILHSPPIGRRSVVKSVQVQKSMHHVEFDFAHQRIAKFVSVLSCGFYTDEDFAGLESYDICRTAVPEELQMQSRDTPI